MDEAIISTHAPYTEGDAIGIGELFSVNISTHAPYTEGDLQRKARRSGSSVFQLTPPIQRATQEKHEQYLAKQISTHAPYTEGDHLPDG